MSEHAQTVRVAAFSSVDGRRDELVTALESVARDASDADGCFGAQVCEIAEEPDVLAVLSRWESRSAVDTFTQEYAERAQDAVAGLTSGPATVLHYESLTG